MFTGYFANCKIFEPRKLRPFSIEFCSAPIAVITDMIENTPIVIPIMVSVARSLFAPNELNAILTISLNNMSILSRVFYHRDHGEHGATMKLPPLGPGLCAERLL